MALEVIEKLKERRPWSIAPIIYYLSSTKTAVNIGRFGYAIVIPQSVEDVNVRIVFPENKIADFVLKNGSILVLKNVYIEKIELLKPYPSSSVFVVFAKKEVVTGDPDVEILSNPLSVSGDVSNIKSILQQYVDAKLSSLATEATLSSIPSKLDDLRNGLKPDRSTVSQELSSYSLNAGSTVETVKSNLSGWSAIVAIIRATYNASAANGVRVRWLYSPDGTNFDSVEDAEAQGNYEDLSFAAGATRQRTILIPILTDYVKIQLVNLDPSYAVTIDAWTLLLR